MLNKLLAVIAAAGVAGIVVGLIPEPPPAKAAGTPLIQLRATDDTNDRAASNGADPYHAVCLQAWPYYERSCLHDVRQPNGIAHEARLVTPHDRRQDGGKRR